MKQAKPDSASIEGKVATNRLDWVPSKIPGFTTKELISSKNGTVKLIKVSPGSRYPLHSHPSKMEYVFILSGNPSFTVSGVEYSAQRDDFVMIPQGKEHSIINRASMEAELLVGAIEINSGRPPKHD